MPAFVYNIMYCVRETVNEGKSYSEITHRTGKWIKRYKLNLFFKLHHKFKF